MGASGEPEGENGSEPERAPASAAAEPQPPAEGEPQLPVGVGPWPGSAEDWPDDPRYDRELLAGGDRRNVIDQYRYWTMEAPELAERIRGD